MHSNIESHLESLSQLEQVTLLQNLLISLSTGQFCNEHHYPILRKILRNDPTLNSIIPISVQQNRDTDQYWKYIQAKFPTYKERRQYIWNEFNPLLDKLETNVESPSSYNISLNLQKIDNEYIHDIWQKALNRKVNDPEGAITIARTLVESVCKHILDSQNIEYNNSTIELSELYKLVAKELNLAPEQHQESIFKQILGGCSGIVNGLGTLRNKLGDAHAAKGQPVKPSTRHAELAVNLSGAMSIFLLDTYHANNK